MSQQAVAGAIFLADEMIIPVVCVCVRPRLLILSVLDVCGYACLIWGSDLYLIWVCN